MVIRIKKTYSILIFLIALFINQSIFSTSNEDQDRKLTVEEMLRLQQGSPLDDSVITFDDYMFNEDVPDLTFPMDWTGNNNILGALFEESFSQQLSFSSLTSLPVFNSLSSLNQIENTIIGAIGASYPTKNMISKYIQEDIAERVPYFNDAQRSQFEVFIRNGILCDECGRPINTNEQTWLYAMSPQGNIYAAPQNIFGRIRHSSFLNGEAVVVAGEFFTEEGIHHFDLGSGHYRPEPSRITYLQSELHARGADLNLINFSNESLDFGDNYDYDYDYDY